jgi:hypothetical protein
LWCKRIFKKATHWFTFEQVNFNSATFNILRDFLEVLSDHEERLSKLKAQIEELIPNAELQAELHGRPATIHQENDRIADPNPATASNPTRLPDDNNSSVAARHKLIDAEIESLARRIEELRSLKRLVD